jgi:hypothetical protein
LADTMGQFWDEGKADIRPFDASISLQGVIYQTTYEFDSDGHARLHPENLSPRLQKALATN